MPALMQKEPVFLIKVGPKKGLGSTRHRHQFLVFALDASYHAPLGATYLLRSSATTIC